MFAVLVIQITFNQLITIFEWLRECIRLHRICAPFFFVSCTFLWSIKVAAIAAASTRKWRTLVLFWKNLSRERRRFDKLASVTLLTLFSFRNTIWSKYWHLGRLTAAAHDLGMRLRLSRHFFSIFVSFFSCFCRNGTKSK